MSTIRTSCHITSNGIANASVCIVNSVLAICYGATSKAYHAAVVRACGSEVCLYPVGVTVSHALDILTVLNLRTQNVVCGTSLIE